VPHTFKSDGARTSEVMHLLSHPPSPSELSGNLSDDDFEGEACQNLLGG